MLPSLTSSIPNLGAMRHISTSEQTKYFKVKNLSKLVNESEPLSTLALSNKGNLT